MNVFDYHDYKQCVNVWISRQSRGGHGQLKQMAEFIGVNSVILSQVFRGSRHLSLEQAVGVSRFIGLTDLERDYFLLLVQKDRAGTHELRKIYEGQIAGLSQASQSLKNRIKHEKFSDEDLSTFYSHWYYSAIRLGVSIPELSSVSAIAEYLKLDRQLVGKVVEFLQKNKLVVAGREGLKMGPQVTHVSHDSPFVSRHHLNWRIKALQGLDRVNNTDLSYTGPMALSKEAAHEIRELLVKLIESSTKLASESESEVLRCLTIDWFDVAR